MWTCPECNRKFKTKNQSHMCSDTTIDDIFEGRPDNLIMAFDKILVSVIDWEPCSVGASTKSVVFTKEKAWLIVKPLSKELDVKFYYPEKMSHRYVKKTTVYRNQVAHHLRVSGPDQVDDEFVGLLYQAFSIG